MFSMDEEKGPKTFILVGLCEGRNKRTQTTYRTIKGLPLDALKEAVSKAVNDAIKKHTK